MKYHLLPLLSGSLGLLVAGCAGTTFHRVANDNSDKGIRYLEYSTYLLVTTDNNGGISSEMINIPDKTRMMSARPWAFMSSNDTTLSFKEGVLATSVSSMDTTKVAIAVADLVKEVGAKMIGANDPGEAALPKGTVPAPRLFKLMNVKGAPRFVEAPVDPMIVNFAPPEPSPAAE
ncbi:hypothetical protein [Luteolibacter sp. Populi]|uniref:hypothetical protein n=1 Tax=Luteolibacter sp. Populi TaxID=3230487 RepID=UPI0034658753